VVRGRGTGVAVRVSVPVNSNRNRTHGGRGWLIAGLSLALLFGVALLKGGADAGGELD